MSTGPHINYFGLTAYDNKASFFGDVRHDTSGGTSLSLLKYMLSLILDSDADIRLMYRTVMEVSCTLRHVMYVGSIWYNQMC